MAPEKMTRVALFDRYLWLMGGGQRVGATLVEALIEAGYDVTLYTVRPFSVQLFEERFGKRPLAATLKFRVDRTLKVRGVGPYWNLFCEFVYRKIGDEDLYMDLSPESSLGATYFRLPDAVYWNAPLSLATYLREYSVKSPRDLFVRPRVSALKMLVRRLKRVRLHLCNSAFTARKLADCPGALGRVLYPPVDTKIWRPKGNSERHGVVSLSRFTKWKRHDLQVKIVDGLNTTLSMIGGARWADEYAVVEALRSLNAPNVTLLVNLPFPDVQRLLWRSKVFLHTAPFEPFGLGTAEAVAAGCIPLVHGSGGAVEVVPFPDMQFHSVEDARDKLVKALAGEYDQYLPALQEQIRKFDESIFRAQAMRWVRALSE